SWVYWEPRSKTRIFSWAAMGVLDGIAPGYPRMATRPGRPPGAGGRAPPVVAKLARCDRRPGAGGGARRGDVPAVPRAARGRGRGVRRVRHAVSLRVHGRAGRVLDARLLGARRRSGRPDLRRVRRAGA